MTDINRVRELAGKASPIKMTPAQRRVVEHIAANPGRLYGSSRDMRGLRHDVVWRCITAGLIEVPRCTPTHTWEATAVGRAALAALARDQETGT